MCVSDDPHNLGNIFKIKILGLCWSSIYDTQYAYNYEDANTYIGQYNSTIKWRDGENWVFTSRTDRGKKSVAPTVITQASIDSIMLGTRMVSMPNDLCTKGKDEKKVLLTFTNCEDSEFTCFDGHCIPFEQRCNRIGDCLDQSDEKDCFILMLDEATYIKDYPPCLLYTSDAADE